MRLSSLAAAVPHVLRGPAADPEVSSLTHDSRRSGPGALFAAFEGLAHDGRLFVAEAASRGAVAALGAAPAPGPLSVPYLEVERPREAAGLLAARLAGAPAERLVMAGVTGTSGKTTTTVLIDRVLQAAFGAEPGAVGLFGTLVYRGAGGAGAALEASRTTPEATELQPMLAALLADGGRAAVMECSSHALVLSRLAGCRFDVAVFTNLSRDHLDYHPSLDDYFEAKALLFGLLKETGKAVVNLDDAPWGARLYSRLAAGSRLGFTLAEAPGARLSAVASLSREGTTLALHDRETGERWTVSSRLLGRPNAENLLAASAAALALGIPSGTAATALASVDAIPGRLEPVPNSLGLTVLVDYAHKPAALEGALKTARSLAGAGRVVCLFGCGGDRDRGKRPEMGRIAAALADATVLTSDNPRSEEPAAILAQVRAGFEESGRSPVVLADRREAIAAALGLARPGDVVLVAGKGHETYQETKGVKAPFDDRVVVREEISARADLSARPAAGARG